jgi:hypothetical protein
LAKLTAIPANVGVVTNIPRFRGKLNLAGMKIATVLQRYFTSGNTLLSVACDI